MTAPRPSGERLCVIHGNSLPEGADPVEGQRVEVDAGGDLAVEATDGGDIVGIPRHGFERSIPAHLVDHRANIRAACELGCNRVLALASVGSLDKDLKVGMLSCPEDFYAPGTAPSFYRDPRGHSVPGFDAGWRDVVISAWASLTDTELEVGGTYAQTIGPRFETPAEVRALAEVADMVGMTIAAEAILAGEATLAYTAICSVDNLANGISAKPLTVDEYRRGRDLTARTLAADLKFVLPALAKGLPVKLSLAITGATLDGQIVGLRAEDGLITELGPGVDPRPGDEAIDGRGMLLCPPMVNAHTHAAMTLFRGFGDDMPLMEWLETRIWPAEAKLEPEDVYWGTRLGCAEMIRAGTTKLVDMYWHGAEAASAVCDAGMRAVASNVIIDQLDPAKGEALHPEVLEVLDQLGEAGPLVEASLGPHAIYTVSPETLRWIAELAAEREIPLHIHLSETQQEVADCVEQYGRRPAHYLDELGFLGPRTVLAHGVWLDDSELELIAERAATVVANPAANMKLAVGGVLPYPQAARAGVSLGLGTDGVSSNSNLDSFEEVKLFALSQKHTSGDPSVLPATEALAIARGLRSPVLGGTTLAVGEPADLLLLRASEPELSAGDLDADLVYAAGGSVVDTTVVAGEVLMRGRQIPGLDEIVAEVRARAGRLTGR